jgi:hypothetical protein
MKKLLWLFLTASALAQTTPNLNLNIPVPGTAVNTWGALLNANFSSLDSYLSGITALPGLHVNGGLTLSYLTGTQCLTETSGSVTGTGSPCSLPYYGIPISNYGTSDFCVALQAAKTAFPLAVLNGHHSFDQTSPTGAITCSTSGYVAGFYGQVYLPFGTIYLQTTFLLQTHSEVYGAGEDASIFKACTGQSYCGSNTFPSSTPLVAWTQDGTTPNFGGPTFDTRLYKVGIDGSSVSGIIGLANYVAQENESGPHDVSIHGWCNGGIGYNWGGYNYNSSNGPGSQNHSVSGLDIYCASGETSTSSAIGILGNTNIIGEAGPKQLENVTVTSNSGIVGTKPNVLVDIKDGTATHINALHMEGAGLYGLELGDGAGVKGLVLSNVNGGNMTGATALVYLSNAANSSSISMSDTDTAGPNFPTYVIDDQLSSPACLIPAATESATARYDLGAPGSTVGGLSRISSSGIANCQSWSEYASYHLDDPLHCFTYNTGGTEQCTNGSLTNPTPGQAFIITAFPPNTTSITVIDNGIGAKTAPIVEAAPWASTSSYLNIGCVSTASFNPYTNGLAVGTITPYVLGTQLGELTVTLNSAYVSGPICIVIYLRGYDQ